MTNSSIFIRLATEIVVQIVAELVNDPFSANFVARKTRRQLKNLRLAYRRFANMDCINALLFDSVQLAASPVVIFINPPSWKLPFETFEQILVETIPKCEREAQIVSAYGSYIRHATDVQLLLEDPTSELRSLWTKTLKLLVEIYGIFDCLASGAMSCAKLTTPITFARQMKEPSTSLGRITIVEYGCRYASAIAGDQLFSTVISTLSASGIAVPQISIKHAMTGTIECTKVPGWGKLNLTALEKLEFGPDIPHDEHHWATKSVIKALPCPKVEEIEHMLPILSMH
ncbi:hypothetical protein FMUND_1812 [Fusarium mundagurra]|uniref:Uncharacterized protein n=1 Tax=Fusarium mundagurra TaxID=1567541 RepID=A0A8H5Z2M8_9HYPO|nr:hypothetical protein FMUND_1812 [Fusarium mundagurra]